MKNCVYIIPNEDKISDSEFYMEAATNHLPCFQAFSDKYGLGYHFGNGDYQEAPLTFDKEEHLVVKIEDIKTLEWMNAIIHEADKRNLLYEKTRMVK